MYDIDMLRLEIKSYLETGSLVLGNGNPFNCPVGLMESAEVDDMTDEQVIEKAKSLGII